MAIFSTFYPFKQNREAAPNFRKKKFKKTMAQISEYHFHLFLFGFLTIFEQSYFSSFKFYIWVYKTL